MQYKILIVDDDPDTRFLISESLEGIRDLRFEAVETDRKAAAIGILEKNGIDAVILDIGLPDNFDLEGVEELRAISKSVAILVLSGTGTAAQAKRAIEKGADAYMVKPPGEPERFAWRIAQAVTLRRLIASTKASNPPPRSWCYRNKRKVVAVLATTAATILAAILKKLFDF